MATKAKLASVTLFASSEWRSRRQVSTATVIEVRPTFSSAAKTDTSMTVAAPGFDRDRHSDEAYLVTKAHFSFVAIGPDRRPRPVRPL